MSKMAPTTTCAIQNMDGGAVRTNLSFAVLPTQKTTKLTDILSAIEANLPPEEASGAVVYCATRGATEKVAEFLKGRGLAADYFHAGLPPDRKRDVQEAFRTGQLPMEADLIAMMQEAVPDAEGAEAQPLKLTETCQSLRDKGHAQVRPDLVETILRGMAQDGRDQDGGRGNLTLRKISRNTIFVRLERSGPLSPAPRSCGGRGRRRFWPI